MGMLGIFVLATAINISTTRSPASKTHDAYNALVKATYLQTGTDKIAQDLEKKYVPKKVKEYGGWITGMIKIVRDQKVSFEWTF
jgi:galactokinase